MTDAEFEAFYERHRKYVYRLCYVYMKWPAEAEDCAEDVFVKVLTGEITFNDEVHERKLLVVAAINLCKDRLKGWKRKAIVPIDDEPELAAPEKEDRSNVLEAVLGLPNKYKDVVWLYYYEGYQTDEIAEILGRPTSTIRNRMRDARKLLKINREASTSERKNPIREEIDKIEPVDGARERMFRNIKRKVVEQSSEVARKSEKKPVIFAKTARWAAPLAACIVAAVVGIVFVLRQNQLPVDSESNVMVGSPFGEEITEDELKNTLGIDFKIPKNAENAVFCVMDGDIGDVRFEVDGGSYLLRFSRKSGDFSGINGALIKSEKIDSSTNAVLDEIEFDGNKHYRLSWTNGEIQFILSSSSSIKNIYEEIK